MTCAMILVRDVPDAVRGSPFLTDLGQYIAKQS